MNDTQATIEQLKEMARHFVVEREWTPFHTPKNLSMNMAVEAAELMEKFLWITTQESFDEVQKNRQEIEDEMADVFFGLLCFANAAKIDISKAFEHKIAEVAAKYPVDVCKGRYCKYDKL